jgi:hypothetical protein
MHAKIVNETNPDVESMDTFQKKRQMPCLGIKCISTSLDHILYAERESRNPQYANASP